MLPDIQGLRYLEFGFPSAGTLGKILILVWFGYRAVVKMPVQDQACRVTPLAKLFRPNTDHKSKPEHQAEHSCVSCAFQHQHQHICAQPKFRVTLCSEIVMMITHNPFPLCLRSIQRRIAMVLCPDIPIVDHGTCEQNANTACQSCQDCKPPRPAMNTFHGRVEAHGPAPEERRTF